MSDFDPFEGMCQEDPEAEDAISWVADDGFWEFHPNLANILFAKMAHGKPREPGRLNLFAQDGRVKICLAMPTEGVVGFWTVTRLASLWLELEEGLKAGNIEWKPDKKHKKAWKDR